MNTPPPGQRPRRKLNELEEIPETLGKIVRGLFEEWLGDEEPSPGPGRNRERCVAYWHDRRCALAMGHDGAHEDSAGSMWEWDPSRGQAVPVYGAPASPPAVPNAASEAEPVVVIVEDDPACGLCGGNRPVMGYNPKTKTQKPIPCPKCGRKAT